ncbi:PEP-CTERM sorting domain-containing protein [Candidatus Poribacteria bacterium]|nr:PEP-CTERM sorting domain-containing protein [Candidatus Poribacteria bacterium]
MGHFFYAISAPLTVPGATPPPIPEPRTLVLFGVGICAVFLVRVCQSRRNRRARV